MASTFANLFGHCHGGLLSKGVSAWKGTSVWRDAVGTRTDCLFGVRVMPARGGGGGGGIVPGLSCPQEHGRRMA